MIWNAIWNRVSLFGEEHAKNREELNQMILLNRFVIISLIPLFLSLFLYFFSESWLMFKISLSGVFICLLILFSTKEFGKEVGWHIGFVLGISLLISLSLITNELVGTVVLLCSFVHLINYICLLYTSPSPRD